VTEQAIHEQAIHKIVYRFGDAPVPPAFHRSYEIIVTRDQVRVTVDRYGEVLATRSYGITRDQFEGVVASLRRASIRRVPRREGDPGCTGGTSEAIAVSNGQGQVFSGIVHHCGGEDTGTLAGDTTRFAADLRRLVPDLGALLATE
jgi:hypothetical protein